MIEQPLFGHGFAQERNLYKKEFGRFSSHNAFIQTYLELGAIGFILFGYILFLLFNKCIMLSKIKEPSIPPLAVRSCIFLLIALCIQSLTGSDLYWGKLPILAISIILCMIRISDTTFLEKKHIK